MTSVKFGNSEQQNRTDLALKCKVKNILNKVISNYEHCNFKAVKDFCKVLNIFFLHSI